MVAEARELIADGRDRRRLPGSWRLPAGLAVGARGNQLAAESRAERAIDHVRRHRDPLVRSRDAPARAPDRGGLRRDRQPPRATTDDHGGCLFRFAGGALGTLVSSQVSPGAKNSFRIKFDGTVRIALLGSGATRGAVARTRVATDRAAAQVPRPTPRTGAGAGASPRGGVGGLEHHVRQPLLRGLPHDPRPSAPRRRVRRDARRRALPDAADRCGDRQRRASARGSTLRSIPIENSVPSARAAARGGGF